MQAQTELIQHGEGFAPAALRIGARLAHDGRLGVRVVLPGPMPGTPAAALAAAEAAGVDVVVESRPTAATVHFVARHPDRRLSE